MPVHARAAFNSKLHISAAVGALTRKKGSGDRESVALFKMKVGVTTPRKYILLVVSTSSQ